MKNDRRYLTLKLRWAIGFMLMSACVESIDFDVPPAQEMTVIEGVITEGPGPHVVKVSRAVSLNSSLFVRDVIANATVVLMDDEGNEELLVETVYGEYSSTGIMQGRVGHAYSIRVELADGKIFRSEPDVIHPAGGIDSIRYEFEPRTVQHPFGIVAADVFNVFVDAHAPPGDERYVRWRFTGTYKVTTYPELRLEHYPPYAPYKNPPLCSGYQVVEGPVGSGGLLERIGDCTCCTCWVRQYEKLPQLSDTELVSGSRFSSVKVGEVPVTHNTFHDKYMVTVEQMSLSRTAFEFFKRVRDQKEGASNVFQPPFGEIQGNISPVNHTGQVVGLFWATSVQKKHIFIGKEKIPYPLPPMDFVTEACDRAFLNATTAKPDNWE